MILKACVIMHNMICYDRSVTYTVTTGVYIHEEEDRPPVELNFVENNQCTYQHAEIQLKHAEIIMNYVDQGRFKVSVT